MVSIQDLYAASNAGLDIILLCVTDPSKVRDAIQAGKKFALRDERTPSSSARQYNGVWKVTDFGDTGHAESPIDLYMRINGIQSFPEAVARLAQIYNLTDDKGRPMHSGSTLTSVIIEGSDLYWVSVGDSRIFIKRSNEMMCVTEDHNYGTILDKKARRGQISREEAAADPERAALVSYMGIGGVPYIDINPYPFPLMNGDTVLLCSDGLYRALSEPEMLRIISSYDNNMQQAAEALTAAAIAKGKRHQDNTTAVLVKYCERVNNSAGF